MQNCLEESRALLETADRQRRAAEQELADTNENMADLSNVNQSIAAARRKLESEYNQLNSGMDKMTTWYLCAQGRDRAVEGGQRQASETGTTTESWEPTSSTADTFWES